MQNNIGEVEAYAEIPSKMTCDDFKQTLPNHDESYPDEDITSLTYDDTKFEGINLEDDIEKVEISSPCTSESEEDNFPLNFPEKIEKNIAPNPEEFKKWLSKLKEMQDAIAKNVTLPPFSPDANLKDLPENNTPIPSVPSRVMKYQDLPYMGEITLNNSKPRRGRKPKKADICHLIYKNYGTILPGTPNASNYSQIETKNVQISNKNDNVQNKVISSLLEKRLTQEHKKIKNKSNGTKKNQAEPINLCVRDLNQLKLRLTKNRDNTYSSEIKSEPASDEDIESSSVQEKSMTKDNLIASCDLKTSKDIEDDSKLVYWPNAGVFLHPMALQQQLLYYQRLSNNKSSPSNQSSRSLPEILPINQNKQKEFRKLVPKIKTKDIKPTEDANKNIIEIKNKRTSSCDKAPTKRKRSAIFIPPIPTENNTNPATEVSICKFKFTGGAKPSLQEKKMLSVDSGGNFRYYSGTGDKSMRGYEFFPRETLQQQASSSSGSSTGAFLQASGEKLFPSPMNDEEEIRVKSEFLLTPDLPKSNFAQLTDVGARIKKKKSKKSIQREKLEQTFKEKGFLIQTQQLESAEGATYCKFRQLKKFTRYLFRSWKDYLPDNLKENEDGDHVNDRPVSVDLSNVSSNSADLSSHSSEH